MGFLHLSISLATPISIPFGAWLYAKGKEENVFIKIPFKIFFNQQEDSCTLREWPLSALALVSRK